MYPNPDSLSTLPSSARIQRLPCTNRSGNAKSIAGSRGCRQRSNEIGAQEFKERLPAGLLVSGYRSFGMISHSKR